MHSYRKRKLLTACLTLILGLLAPSVFAQPQPLPAAPTILKVVPGNGQLSVNLAIAQSKSPVVNLEYSLDGGTSWTSMTPAVTSGPIIITGLVNGQSYSVAVRGVNGTGAGAPSKVKLASPATVPDAPHIDFIKGTGMWFHVYFSAGTSDGHSLITQWQFDIDQTGQWRHWGRGAKSPQTVMMPWAKLGDSHVIRIRSVNAVGFSEVSNLVTVTMFKTGLHLFQ